jgi:ubiquinone biosynthesis protein UbiJ
VLLEQVAALVNRNIAASARARELATRLEGRAMRVSVSVPFHVSVRVSIAAGSLVLSREAGSETADVRITGTPLSLLPLLGADARAHLQSGAIEVDGDAEIAQAFHELLHAARPELEEELSRHVGDVAARQVGNVLRTVSGWSSRTASTFADNVSEFLQEESRDLVSRTEGEEFNAAVDELREAVDRIAARIDLLERGRS